MYHDRSIATISTAKPGYYHPIECARLKYLIIHLLFLFCNTGEAAYVAANHRSFLPIFLLGGMLFTVLVIYVILFKKLKPYHSIEQKYTHSNANGDVVELVTAKQDETIETEVTSL